MFCRRCGGEIFDAQAKCPKCGWSKAEQTLKSANQPAGRADPEALYHQSEERVTPSIVRGQDGVLRWVYEMSMWKNPTMLITTAKVLLLSCGIMGLILFFIGLREGFMEALRMAGMAMAIGGGILLVLLLPAYAIIALINGGHYTVLFEMDEKGVTHRQLQSQFKKVRTLAGLGILLGVASGNVATTAASYNAATRSSMHSGFATVKKAVINPRRQVIYLNETLERNQIYAKPEDFGFVCDFIVNRLNKNTQIIRQ